MARTYRIALTNPEYDGCDRYFLLLVSALERPDCKRFVEWWRERNGFERRIVQAVPFALVRALDELAEVTHVDCWEVPYDELLKPFNLSRYCKRRLPAKVRYWSRYKIKRAAKACQQ